MRPLVLLVLISGALAARAGEARAPLRELDLEATKQVEESKAGRIPPVRFHEWKTAFRAKLEAEVSRSPLTPDDTALHARIMTRIGDGKNAVAMLDRALEGDEQNPTLLSTKGKVLYEQNDYQGAASSALQAWEASGHKDNDAWTLYMMSKGRGTPATPASLPQTSATDSSRKETPSQTEIRTTPSKKKSISSVAPGLSGQSDPAWMETAGARGMLQKSRLGNEVLTYAIGEGVKFELADMPANVGAQYEKDRNVIRVPKNVATLNTVEMAKTIGHEAYHARQALRDGMLASVESEQDANFAERVIYHELVQAGAQPLFPGTNAQSNFERWRDQIRYQDFKTYNEDIRMLYEGHKKQALQDNLSTLPAGIRGAARWALEAVDADFLRDYETLDDQEAKWWNLPDRLALERTRKQHRIEQAWQLRWMKEHQGDFPPPTWPR